MKGIDYKALYEDLEFKLYVIGEKALKIQERSIMLEMAEIPGYDELIDFICSSLAATGEDHEEEKRLAFCDWYPKGSAVDWEEDI